MSDQNEVMFCSRGIEHIGLTVPNLHEAIDFFVNVLGCEPFYDLGPFNSDDDWMVEHMNVHPRAEVKRLKFLRCKTGPNLELFEYSSPDQNRELPKNSDVGGHHLAFYVDDLDQAVSYLKSKGVKILGEPTRRTEGPSGGQSWVYFLTPWGLSLELVCYPKGKAYEQDYDKRLWHPAYPEL
jgi:catechol 2,3-dioxygenase-like lactoylglutathione lyase family enzyme